MNLYLISQTENHKYYVYDSAVVAANTESEARTIHPSGTNSGNWSLDWSSPDTVAVKLIGRG